MQSLTIHFREVRLRFLYLSLSGMFSFLVSYLYKYELLYILSKPFLEFHKKFIFLDLTEALSTMIRVSGLISFFIIIPLVFYHFWSFLIPSCYIFERKIINHFLWFFFFLFFLELLTLYFFLFPKLCEFLLSFEIKSLENTCLEKNFTAFSIELAPRIESYFQLIFRFFFLFLSIFQLPFVFMLFYSKKWIHFSQLCEKRKYVLFFCILLSAFLSPPDVWSQSLLCLFSYILYEFIIFLGMFYEPPGL